METTLIKRQFPLARSILKLRAPESEPTTLDGTALSKKIITLCWAEHLTPTKLSHRASVHREVIDQLQMQPDEVFVTDLDAIADALGVRLDNLLDQCEQLKDGNQTNEPTDFKHVSFSEMRLKQAMQEWRRRTIRLQVKRAGTRRASLVAERDMILATARSCRI